MQGSQERHIVVADCNIFLNVVNHLRRPMSRDLEEEIGALRREIVVERQKASSDQNRLFVESAQLLVMAARRSAPDGLSVELHCSDHIQDVTHRKITHPTTALQPEDRGLGLSQVIADSITDEFIPALVATTAGALWRAGTHTSDKNPPLDHEDGMVYGLCRHLSGLDAFSTVWCITFDRGFREQAANFERAKFIIVVEPREFIRHVNNGARRRMLRATVRESPGNPPPPA